MHKLLIPLLMILVTAYVQASSRVIILPDDATPGERYAAKELQDHIERMAGVRLISMPERLYTKTAGPCMSIGRTAMSRRYVTDGQMESLGNDGYTVFAKDGNAFFVGGRRRGSMYAVYEYLESLGVRWYSPDHTVIPKLADLPMPKSFEFTPEFWYRDQWWNNGTTNGWLARMRINGNNGQDHMLPDSMGGSVVTMNSCHSYATIVPPSENFEKHPDWFAVKGNGSRSGNELCLTNPELREFATQKVLADLRANPKVENYWVSQNDGGGSGCFCEKCTAERLAHGGPGTGSREGRDKDRWSANTISFASYIANQVKAEFPNVRIKTLAYNYTQAAPENLSAPDNVLVEVCGNFGPGDDRHVKLVNAWSKVAKSISVYTYGGSNYGYWWPYPNVREVGMQYPWARQAGVTAFYVQGTALGKGSGLVDLRAYISARLAWDPSRDVNKKIRDFCDGFYGPGGKYIVEYLDWYSAYIKQHKFVMEGGWGDSERWRDWVTKEAMDHCDGLFQKALAVTKDNPTFHNHVRRAYLEVLWGGIMINLKPGSSLMDKDLAIVAGADPDVIQAKAHLFGEIMRENGYNMWAEWLPFEAEKYPH